MGKPAKGRPVSRFAKPSRTAKTGQEPEEIARMACKEGTGVEKMPPHAVIRHVDVHNFWEKCVHQDEISWETFWLHFPSGLPPEVLVDSAFSSQKERTEFQTAVHVIGPPEHITASMLDITFPPGSSIGVTTARLLKDTQSEKRMTEISKTATKHVSLGLQSAGFWDEAPLPLPAFANVSSEVAAELSYANGERSQVAQVLGHIGSGAASIAAGAAKQLVDRNFWTSATCVGLKGAGMAEVAAARVASSLRILSYPVVADELLRLTAYFHTRASQPGRTGIVLDAEGCTTPEELQGLALLVTTIIKAGSDSVQIIVAGEGALQLSSGTHSATFRVPHPDRDEEKRYLERSVRAYLGGSAAAVAAACGHQLALMKLAVANLQSGKTLPQTLIGAMCANVPDGADSTRGKSPGLPAESVVRAVMSTLGAEEREALHRLSILPHRFTLAAASKVLAQKEEAGVTSILAGLEEKGFVRSNLAMAMYGLLPSIRAVIREDAKHSPAVFEAAVIALAEYSLGLAETAAALNASNSQVGAMWVIDREREIFDEVTNLLHDSFTLPAATTAVYADLVSKYMDLLGFRLSVRQQQELCTACAQASRAEGDMLAEAHCLQHLGQIGNIQAADGAMARAMATVEKALTPTHPVIADMLLSWARLQTQAGNFVMAEKLLRRSLEIQLQQAQGKAMAIAATRTRLAGVLIGLSVPQRARPYLQTALDATAKELGPYHPDTALAQCRLASCLADLREYEGAHKLYLMALDGWRKSLGHCHPQFATLLGQLAFCCCRLGKPEDAEQYYRRSIEMWKEMMVLDQPELQDDLRALADLLQGQGRAPEAAEIREQLHRLIEAVRAAHNRTWKRRVTHRKSLMKRLLRPIRAFCVPTDGGPTAFVALPTGIQDSDLEELRNAARPEEDIVVEASPAPEAIETKAAAVDVLEASISEAPQAEPTTAQTSKTEVAGDAPKPKPEPASVIDITAEANIAATGPPIEAETRTPKSNSSQAGTKGGKPAARPVADKTTSRPKDYPQGTVPFGSKGVPSTVENSKWAASLRNPAANPHKKTSSISAAARNDSSVQKNRLFTAGETRYSAGKSSGGFQTSPTAEHNAEDLIRAHTTDEKEWADAQLPDPASAAGEAATGYASDDTLTDGPAGPATDRSGDTSDLISQVHAIDPSRDVGKNVIGFFNPMYAQYGISRSSSQAASMLDDKVEI